MTPPPGSIEWSDDEPPFQPALGDAHAYLAARGIPGGAPRGALVPLVEARAWLAMVNHVTGDLANERGGMLLGSVLRDPDRQTWVVHIHGAAPARGAEESSSAVTWTAATWSAFQPELEALPADQTIVGSYHSHPGHGVFLSSTDLDTQRAVYPEAWQVAAVIDPVAGEAGFFAGAAGRHCSRWFVLRAGHATAAPTLSTPL